MAVIGGIGVGIAILQVSLAILFSLTSILIFLV